MLLRTIRTIGAAARRTLRGIGRRAHQLWMAHQRLLRDNPAYAASATAGAACVAGQESALDLIAAIAATALAVYAATRRGFARR